MMTLSAPRGGGLERACAGRARVRGFSLVEVVVTLLIAGVVTALAAPNFRNLIFDNRQVATSNRFVTTLQMARSAAMTRQVPVTVLSTDAGDATNEWSKGWTIFVDTNGDSVQDAGEEVIRVGEASSATLAIDSVEDAAAVQFQPIGITGAAPASLRFDVCDTRAGEEGRRVTISGTGKISVAKRSCA